MITFDTDVVTDVLRGRPQYVERIARIPREDQAITIVVVEEVMRGRLAMIRSAESGRGRLTVGRADALFHDIFADFRQSRLLPFTEAAEQLFQTWRGDLRRIGTHDLRIAATCIVHKATLVTRNRRDFERVPGLKVEFWG